MRPPPAVSLSCDDGGHWRRVQALLAALTAGVLVRWLAALGGLGGSWGWSLALGAALVVAWRVWRGTREAPPRLAWDGQRWQILRAGAAPADLAQLRVAVDLGGWMLLRVMPAAGGPAHWLAAGAAAAAAARPALFATEARPPRADEAGPATGSGA